MINDNDNENGIEINENSVIDFAQIKKNEFKRKEIPIQTYKIIIKLIMVFCIILLLMIIFSINLIIKYKTYMSERMFMI